MSHIAVEAVTRAVGKSSNYKETTRKLSTELNYEIPYRNVRNFIKANNIDVKHFGIPVDLKIHELIPLERILVVNSTYHNTSRIKKRLWKAGLLKEECSECKQLPLWNDKLLVLQLDHINGINNDNRLENLRILCPNCHTQTGNYVSKNKR